MEQESETAWDFVYANPKETGKDKKEFMKILMLDIIGSERSLQNLIEWVIEIDQGKFSSASDEKIEKKTNEFAQDC